jgi:serine/threonine-protein kinase HipA
VENRCLYCYQLINEISNSTSKITFHTSCSKKFFGSTLPPIIDFDENQLADLAEKIIQRQKTVTGVQPKLSLGLTSNINQSKRLTIVGLLGEYILKPQTEEYLFLPENEDLTMHLASLSKLKTVPHTLIQLQSDKKAYLTKRIDRATGLKLHMEDMCQLTERLTEQKYQGSYEQIANVIKKHSINPLLDLINFYELVLFCFLTGNNDMHLKNFSLINKGGGYTLCPAYDLVATQLILEDDNEDLALHLNGKKKKIKKSDFIVAMKTAGIEQKVIDNIFIKFNKLIQNWFNFIEVSFLSEELKIRYIELIKMKAKQIEL